MLLYGPASCLGIGFNDNTIVYNFTSMKEGYISLQGLIPPNSIGKFVDREFDIAYANYILQNDQVFSVFFQIIYNLYIGKDVFIIVSPEDWSENLVESLLKLIQQRYGYNGALILNNEDYIDAALNMEFRFDPGYGLMNLDYDKERIVRISTINAKIPNENMSCTGQCYE